MYEPRVLKQPKIKPKPKHSDLFRPDQMASIFDNPFSLLSGVPDFFDRNKILSGYDLSHYQVPHCIRVFFYFV